MTEQLRTGEERELHETPSETRARLVQQLEVHQADVENREATYENAREKASKANAVSWRALRDLADAKEARDKVRQMLIDALPTPDPEPEEFSEEPKR